MDRSFRRRFERKLTLIFALSFLPFLLSLLRVLDLQVTKESEVARKIEKSFDRVFLIKTPLYRGSLQDTKGRELALSVPTVSVYAHPDASYIKDKEAFIAGLSKITGVPVGEIRRNIEAGGKPVRILTDVDARLKEEIRKLIRDTGNTSYVGLEEGYRRTYPNGTLASNLIGFVGVDGRGLEGMEYLLDGILGGGYSDVLVYLGGGLGKIYLHPLKGVLGEEKDVILTLDVGIQSILERIRDDIVERWRPKKVSIILLDLSNGHILGLATYPYFDPNRFYDYPPQSRRNIAVTDLFEPGSTLKPFFIAYALEKGYVSTRFTVNTGDGRIKVFDRYVKDVKALGRIDLGNVVVHSSNVGTIKVASYLNRSDVEDLLERFHLKDKLGVLPGEAKPRIPDLRYKVNILYSSIGQGIAVNTLSLAVAFGGLATGRILKPHIVKEVITSEGKVVYRAQVEVLKDKVFSEGTLRWIREMLTQVVERGTGRRARSEFFTIAGKTGTSQKFDFKLGEYSRDRVVTYFAGFFPASDPRFVAALLVDEPKGKDLYGGNVSAPYFRRLVEQVAFYVGLKPDKLK